MDLARSVAAAAECSNKPSERMILPTSPVYLAGPRDVISRNDGRSISVTELASITFEPTNHS